jgi:hypothetical protein
VSISIADWKRVRYLEQLAEHGGPSMEKTIEMASLECHTVEQLELVLRTLMDPKTGLVHQMADTAQKALKEGGWMDPQEAAQAVQKALNEEGGDWGQEPGITGGVEPDDESCGGVDD